LSSTWKENKVEAGSFALVGASMLQQRRLEIAANNLAQVNTSGFKSDVPIFRIYDAPNPTGQESQFPKDSVQQPAWKSTHVDYSQGSFKQTNNPLDLAINGDGFFTLSSPDGLRFSRAGQFSLNEGGVLVSPQGWPVLDDGNQEIQINNASSINGGIYINQTGQVVVDGQVAGTIKLADFPKPYALVKRGFASFTHVDPNVNITTPEKSAIFQGYIESSNVNAISEMVRLIEISRLYEAYQKSIQTFDAINDRAVNDLGRVEKI